MPRGQTFSRLEETGMAEHTKNYQLTINTSEPKPIISANIGGEGDTRLLLIL